MSEIAQTNNELIKNEDEQTTNSIKWYCDKVKETTGNRGLDLTSTGLQCTIQAISALKNFANSKKKKLKDYNQDSIMQVLLNVGLFELNVAGMPPECYISERNVFVAGVPQKPRIELNLEGDGHEKIARMFGANVKTICRPWLVRENDPFTYPKHAGTQITPPTWEETHTGKVVRVVYPIIYKDGREEYIIEEKADVAVNLKAHISNNLLGNKSLRDQIVSKIKDMTLDEMLNDPSLDSHISSVWKNFNQEKMFIRKMKNNAMRSIPKEFKNLAQTEAYKSTFEDYDQYKTQSVQTVDLTEESKPQIPMNVDFSKLTENMKPKVKEAETVVVAPEDDFMSGIES